MSHLLCPLCGKNAPLSTLNPDGIDLDVKVVSFKGLGYGRGFAKSEEHSILGDGEYSPLLASRSLQLCSMFLRAGVLRMGDVENALNISSTKEYPNLNNALNDQIEESQHVIASLENQMREMNEEEELKDEVDYIIREGVEFTDPGCITADSGGWCLKLTPDELKLKLYLHLVVRELPTKLKDRVLPHIKADEESLWYETMLKNIPKRKSVVESMIDEERESIIPQKDGDGTVHEFRFEAVHFVDQSSNTIPIKTLKKIVSNAKNLMNDPNDAENIKKIFEGI